MSDESRGISRRAATARLGALVTGLGTAAGIRHRVSLSAALLEGATARGEPDGSATAHGERSPYEDPKRSASQSTSTTPLQELHGTITPSDLHFEVHNSGIPAIDPAAYKLLLHGLVDRPTAFSLADLKRLPSETRTCFIECAGNYPRNAPVTATPEMMAGLTSQSEWTGVPLRVLLHEVGLSPKARWFLAEGADRAHIDRSIPVEKGLDDAFLAYAQNGEALRPAQGYPVRLVLPGWEGNTNIKWLRRLKFAVEPFMTRWETSRYSDGLPDARIRQFSFVIDARSIITFPAPPATLAPGWIDLRGIAWSGRGRITRVELSTDGGGTWRDADLQGPVLSKAHTRFGKMWHWDGKECVILSRAIDETGYVQPTLAELRSVRGRDTGPYHLNPIIGWRIPADGRLELRQEAWG